MTASPHQLGQIREEVAELLAESKRARGLKSFAKYKGKRALFAKEVFGVTLWGKQLEALELTDANRRVCVVSAHGIGKTLAVAVEVFYQTLVNGPCLVICVSAVQDQMRYQTFSEMHQLFLRAKNLPGKLYTDSYRIDPATRHGAIGLGTNQPGRLTGYHNVRLVVIVDEAHGLEDQMWPAVMALAVGEDDRVLALGNPGPPVGPWFNISRSEAWAQLRVSSLEHPNVATGRNVIPGAITRAKIEEYAADHGSQSPTYRRLVEGLFTEDSSELITTSAHLERAHELWLRVHNSDVIRADDDYIIGVDPARLGPDLTALCIAQSSSSHLVERPVASGGWTYRANGPQITLVHKFETFGQQDLEECVRRIRAVADARGIIHYQEGHRFGQRYGRLIVDEPGVGGGVLDRLKAVGYSVVPFTGARAVAEEESKARRQRYKNLRAAAYWWLRKMLEEGTIAIPRHERLWDELLSTGWSMDPSDRIVIQPKDEIRTNLGRSPDLADSLSLVAYWAGRRKGTIGASFITL